MAPKKKAAAKKKATKKAQAGNNAGNENDEGLHGLVAGAVAAVLPGDAPAQGTLPAVSAALSPLRLFPVSALERAAAPERAPTPPEELLMPDPDAGAAAAAAAAAAEPQAPAPQDMEADIQESPVAPPDALPGAQAPGPYQQQGLIPSPAPHPSVRHSSRPAQPLPAGASLPQGGPGPEQAQPLQIQGQATVADVEAVGAAMELEGPGPVPGPAAAGLPGVRAATAGPEWEGQRAALSDEVARLVQEVAARDAAIQDLAARLAASQTELAARDAQLQALQAAAGPGPCVGLKRRHLDTIGEEGPATEAAAGSQGQDLCPRGASQSQSQREAGPGFLRGMLKRAASAAEVFAGVQCALEEVKVRVMKM